MANTRSFFKRKHIPLSESGGQGSCALLPLLSLFFCSQLASWKSFNFRVEARDTTKSHLKPLHLKEAARCAARGMTHFCIIKNTSEYIKRSTALHIKSLTVFTSIVQLMQFID